METQLVTAADGGHVIHLEGRDYLRLDRHWYDAKSRIGLPAIEASRLEVLMRGQPDLYESVVAAEKREALERHEAFVRAFGVTHRSAGPSRGWINRVAHCWACKHPVDSATDSQCYKCGWILCACGGCGAGSTGGDIVTDKWKQAPPAI